MRVVWTKPDIAWAAGLFEGEGCISISSGYIRLLLNMTDEDVVNKFASVVGCGKVRRRFPPSVAFTGRKPQFLWDVSTFEKAQAILAAFWPWLGERRRAKAIEALQRGRNVLSKNGRFCRKGHEFVQENTILVRGYRNCRICMRARNISFSSRRAEAKSEFASLQLTDLVL